MLKEVTMTGRSSSFRRIAGLACGIAVAAVVSAVSLRAQDLPPGNAAQQWNKIAEDTVVGSGAFQNEGLIYMAYVSAAIYDAVVVIQGGYEPYGRHVAAPPNASVTAAVIEAAHYTLRYYFPTQSSSLDSWHDQALAQVPEGPAKLKGIATGRTVAKGIIELRKNDGRITPIAESSSFPAKEPAPGVWRLTPPAFAPPQTPWVGSVKPFVIRDLGEFQPQPPPTLDSQRWIDQFNEIWLFGSLVSGTRTADETAAARFWTANVIRQYNRLGRDLSTARSLDVLQTARLLAMINVVGADAQIAVMHWKYEFLFWRPVTAIDPFAVTNDGFGPVPGFVDGNDGTPEESGWRPLVTTPNHPEYPAAHGSITSAVAEVLTVFGGTDQIDVDIRGFDPAGAMGNLNATRHFDTAAQLREEIVNARLWGGVHYRGSSEAGVDLGRNIAAYALAHAFRPTE
jgi:hypothetical protein